MSWPRRRRVHTCPASRRVTELAAELAGQAADGHVYVRIGHVLDVLDPEHKHALLAVPPPDPRADPVTGCLPVAAPGASDAP